MKTCWNHVLFLHFSCIFVYRHESSTKIYYGGAQSMDYRYESPTEIYYGDAHSMSYIYESYTKIFNGGGYSLGYIYESPTEITKTTAKAFPESR